MTIPLLGRVDALLGDGIEAAVRYKHRRRLSRLGWGEVYDLRSPGVFATGDPPPREGCELQVLIDGANAMPVIAAALEQASSFVHITGWHVAPSFAVVRDQPHGQIGVLLAELAERIDVRVLVWSGAPVPAFHPTRREVKSDARESAPRDPDPGLRRSTRASLPLPSREDGGHRR